MVCGHIYIHTHTLEHIHTEKWTDVHTDSPADMGETVVVTQHHSEGLI